MKFRYGKLVLAGAAALCLSTSAYAGGPGEESAEETPAAAPAVKAAEPEPSGITLGDWIPGTLSGSVGAFSDYSFRGVSQTQTGFSGQAGLTWKQDCGFYIGAWGSNLHYGSGDDANWEQDILVGFSNSIGNFGYDLSATALVYPKASKYTYFEFAAKTTYNVADIVTLKLGGLYSPDYFGILNNAGYISTGFNLPLPIPENRFATLALDANVGYTISDQFVYASNNKYVDWNVGMIVGLSKNLSLDLRYVDTDLNIGSIADKRFVGGATFSF